MLRVRAPALKKATIGRKSGVGGEMPLQRDRTGRSDMKLFHPRLVDISMAMAAVAALTGLATTLPANAAPPTVTPSPGYDARLQESRAAAAIDQPTTPGPRLVSRHVVRRKNHGPY
jgi:hypothetical protein